MKFIKLETSKLIYEYLIQELSKCFQFEVSNEFIQQNIKYFKLEIELHD